MFINKSRLKRLSGEPWCAELCIIVPITASPWHPAAKQHNCSNNGAVSRIPSQLRSQDTSRPVTHLSLRDTNLTTFRRQHAVGSCNNRQISGWCCDTGGRDQSGNCLWSESFVSAWFLVHVTWRWPGREAGRRPPATSLFSPAADTAAWCRL